MAAISEITCKSAITWHSNKGYVLQSLRGIRSWQSLKYLLSTLWKSGVARASAKSYSVNPYAGCTHGCTYCYVEFQKGIRHSGERWGDFVDAKLNIADVLTEQIKNIPRGEVFVASVTDAYQPVEAKYKLTRQVIEILLSEGFGVTVLTKSALVTRDIDILKHPRCKVGISVTVPDDEISCKLEPGCSSTSQRLAALHKLHDSGVSTWGYIAPTIPTFTDEGDNIERLIGELAKCQVAFVASDTFNPFPSSWLRFRDFLKHEYPERMEAIKEAILLDRSFFTVTQERIKKACEANRLVYRSGSVA